MSGLTFLMIKAGSVRIQAGGPVDGKWAGWIMRDEDRWAPLINTEAIYSSEQEAKAAMTKLADGIKKLDIEDKDGIQKLFEEVFMLNA